eukprot:scaffold61115_cov19-Tisochrysis_lutea.AAC.6
MKAHTARGASKNSQHALHLQSEACAHASNSPGLPPTPRISRGKLTRLDTFRSKLRDKHDLSCRDWAFISLVPMEGVLLFRLCDKPGLIWRVRARPPRLGDKGGWLCRG